MAATDLTEALESSVQAAQTGGRFVAAWDLPTEEALTAAQAQLARGVRTQRRLRAQEVLPMPTEDSR
ncbi:MAG TPA: hypothetical protein VL494_13420 [Steroidobacteraceae bacterium]|jgi:hypothetical protein|nr:hypothetical protein [Steroidobacteraceae bacterium]